MLQQHLDAKQFLQALINVMKKIPRKNVIGFMVALCVICTQPQLVIDGVTAATAPSPPAHPAPTLMLSPTISNNVIHTKEGQTVTIAMSASDPNGYNTVRVGIQSNLPEGASFVLDPVDESQATFTWTPAIGSATKTPSVVVKFFAQNYHWKPVTQRNQTITIKVDDDAAPSFDQTALSPTQILKVDTPLKLPVVVNPDLDNDTVLLSATDLPAGAKLGKAVRNAKGQWISKLVWTPSLAQIGLNTIIFIATDDSVSPTQVTYPVEFNVGYVAAPSFAVTMPTTKTVVVNKKLSFKVTVNADPYSKLITISPTNMPAGATLSSAKKVGKLWQATFSWKPTLAQVGEQLVTFAATDPAAGTNSAPILADVTFTVNPK